MTTKTLATVVFISIGAGIMGASLLATRRVLALVARSRFANKWRALFTLMVFFFVGYLASLALSLSGLSHILPLLTGVIFLLGAAFVNLVVHVGRQTIEDLLSTTVSKAHFAKTIETMADALIVLDQDLTVRTVNQAATDLSGYARDELIGSPAADVFSECDLFRRPEELLGGQPVGKLEKSCRTRDGHDRTVAFSWSLMHGDGGRPEGVVCLVQDISERKLAEQALKESKERLKYSATHDSLTGLPNRALIVDRIDRVVEKGRRNANFQFAVLFLDLDRFKTINDSLGHAVGDELVKVVAGILEGCVRGTDTVGRLGGDEFVIVLEDIHDVVDAIRVAERVEQDLSGVVEVGDHELYVKVSVGIVLSETGYESTGDVLRDADVAMYRAKAHGGNRYEVFDAAMRERMTSRLSLENALRHAVERDQFEVYYQPIVDLKSGATAGFEALLRWHHPDLGLLPPLDFIPLAEETGLILEIDRWVLREACRQTKAWQPLAPGLSGPTISVNMSSTQFLQPDLVSHVAWVLRKTGLDASRLKLEITETAFIDNLDRITSTLSDLRELGVRIVIDDFGTGYSSLSYLHRLPVDTLKIDRSFVRNLTEGGTDLAIVHTIMLLVQALDIKAVAEGVETDEQRRQLRDLQCDFAQGHLFAKPMPSSAIPEPIALDGMASECSMPETSAPPRQPPAVLSS